MKVDELREEILVMKGSVETALTETDRCKGGLDDYIIKAHDEYSSRLNSLISLCYDFTQALVLPGIPQPTFSSVQVNTQNSEAICTRASTKLALAACATCMIYTPW